MIGKQLKTLRKNSKKSQQEVCTSLNIEQSTLANYENDKRIPKIDILIKIANYYNVSVDYLLGRTENQNISTNYLLETEQINHDSNKQVIESTCQKEEKLLFAFRQLNDDNQDIIIGEIKKILKEQKYDEAALLLKKIT